MTRRHWKIPALRPRCGRRRSPAGAAPAACPRTGSLGTGVPVRHASSAHGVTPPVAPAPRWRYGWAAAGAALGLLFRGGHLKHDRGRGSRRLRMHSAGRRAWGSPGARTGGSGRRGKGSPRGRAEPPPGGTSAGGGHVRPPRPASRRRAAAGGGRGSAAAGRAPSAGAPPAPCPGRLCPQEPPRAPGQIAAGSARNSQAPEQEVRTGGGLGLLGVPRVVSPAAGRCAAFWVCFVFFIFPPPRVLGGKEAEPRPRESAAGPGRAGRAAGASPPRFGGSPGSAPERPSLPFSMSFPVLIRWWSRPGGREPPPPPPPPSPARPRDPSSPGTSQRGRRGGRAQPGGLFPAPPSPARSPRGGRGPPTPRRAPRARSAEVSQPRW